MELPDSRAAEFAAENDSLRTDIDITLAGLNSSQRKSANRTLAFRALQEAYFYIGLDIIELKPNSVISYPRNLPPR